MSSANGAGADPEGSRQSIEIPRDSQLVEALMFLLIEKGVLTRNDALSVVQTVAQVQLGAADDYTQSGPQTQAGLQTLHRMYRSFEMLADQPGDGQADWANVRHLRPPVHGDRPAFPRDD